MAWRDSSPYMICFAMLSDLLAVAAIVSVLSADAEVLFLAQRISSSRMMRYSSPSSLISWPEYLPKRIVSPALTSSGVSLPSFSVLPLPTAMTLPCCGFSLAVSGMMIPPTFCSPSSANWTGGARGV